mmetsp:Transcript_11922/g.17792  ORF Transcript_11922/g.17792 Transcript_11922/m.17792 type:complete len:318 (+) Transcript_11922:3-956(+)
MSTFNRLLRLSLPLSKSKLSGFSTLRKVPNTEPISLIKEWSAHISPWQQPVNESADESVAAKDYNEDEKRCGAYALKVGMTSIWDAWGVCHAVTILHIDSCQILQVINEEKNGYTALQVGVGEAKPKNVPKSIMGLYNKSGVPPKRKIGEFRVTPNALLPVGFRIRAQHFLPGQLIDVQGTTKGKGFQGAMKRHNFKGQGASHGVSKTHRHIGSTGQCQTPGRVFKGKKMPGRMGGARRTVQCLKILKVDTLRDLLYVKGHIPGNKGHFVRIQDAIKRSEFPANPPFPSYVPKAGEELPVELFAPIKDVDPMGYLAE